MKFSTDFICATKEYCTFKHWVNAPYFRKVFTLADPQKAELTICGLGLYELYVNGQRVTKSRLASYTSNPDQILYYDHYDLTPVLQSGKNVLGVWLGNGMLNCLGGRAWNLDQCNLRSAPKMALCFEAQTAEGDVEFTAKDGFLCSDSPILLDDLRIGEFYDARLEQKGWNTVDFDDTAWRTPLPASAPRGEITLCNVDPIVVTREVAPAKIYPGKLSLDREWFYPRFKDFTEEEYFAYSEFSPNEEGYVYDFGINSAGVCRIHIKNAKPGQRIALQFAERADADGNLDVRCTCILPKAYNNRAIYVCRGGDEVWEQTFTYFGYRYVLVMGIEPAQATPDLLTYVEWHTKLEEKAEFDCSHPVVNQLWKATMAANYANFYHYPTDCPHREKLGWTADIALSAEQMMLTLSAERNFKEWMHNVRNVMREDGALPCIIPTNGYGFAWGAGPAWDMALVWVPYYVWLYRGNTEILKENTTAIFRYLQYISSRRDKRGLIHIGLGDWAPAARANAEHFQAPLAFTDTAICMDICKKSAKIFEVCGMQTQKEFALQLWGEFRTAARKYLIDTNRKVAYARCQTAQAMAIHFDIFDEAEKPAAFEHLLQIIHNEGDGIYCGVLGVRVLFHVLSAFGRTDLAFQMITRPEYPSYGYMMRHYDASLWETFQPDEAVPSSRNHHFLGDVISWFMQNLVGIKLNPYAEDCNYVQFAPQFIAALDHAKGSHLAPLGKIEAAWQRQGDEILYTVTLPEGMEAELCLPIGYKTEDGYTQRAVQGTVTYRIIAEDKPDVKRLTSLT